MNGKYAGGGMKFSPKSKREDDVIELLVIQKNSEIFIIFNISNHLFWRTYDI